jgi:hypothetical protein
MGLVFETIRSNEVVLQRIEIFRGETHIPHRFIDGGIGDVANGDRVPFARRHLQVGVTLFLGFVPVDADLLT